MTTVELLIYIIFRGLAIGILVSAPMGPIGVLCIQRTLNGTGNRNRSFSVGFILRHAHRLRTIDRRRLHRE